MAQRRTGEALCRAEPPRELRGSLERQLGPVHLRGLPPRLSEEEEKLDLPRPVGRLPKLHDLERALVVLSCVLVGELQHRAGAGARRVADCLLRVAATAYRFAEMVGQLGSVGLGVRSM